MCQTIPVSPVESWWFLIPLRPHRAAQGGIFFVVVTKLSFVKRSRAGTIATPPRVTFGHPCSSPLALQFPVRERAASPAQGAHSQLLIPDSQKESNEFLGAGEESSGLSRVDPLPAGTLNPPGGGTGDIQRWPWQCWEWLNPRSLKVFQH